MGIAFSFESDDFEQQLDRQSTTAIEERLARALADQVRETGAESTDGIPVDTRLEDPDGRLRLDEAWIRARAEEILRGF
jgi:hypothetical protein